MVSIFQYPLFYLPSYRRAREVWVDSGMNFDGKWGVDTGGIILPDKGEVIGPNWVYGTRYQGIEPGSLEGLLRELHVRYQDYTFIDFGSGKGRAILVASRFPFKRIIGVEYCPKLNGIARDNLLQFPDAEKKCTDIELSCTDAATYPIPEEDLIIFLFNPFSDAIMKELIGNVRDSLERFPRNVFVLYANPVHGELWKDAGFTLDMSAPKWISIFHNQYGSKKIA